VEPLVADQATRHSPVFWVVGLILVVVVGAALLMNPRRAVPTSSSRELAASSVDLGTPAFAGRSTELKQTAIVPTLETPLPDNSSAIWCGSLNLSWKELRGLAGGDVTMHTLPHLTEQLNVAAKKELGLQTGHYYAKAGQTTEGIYDVIRKELAARFPKAKPPERVSLQDGVVTYAYLELASKFQHEFFDLPGPLPFRDGRGNKTGVKAFGIFVVDEMNPVIGS
jgi:hypothetical protein